MSADITVTLPDNVGSQTICFYLVDCDGNRLLVGPPPGFPSPDSPMTEALPPLGVPGVFTGNVGDFGNALTFPVPAGNYIIHVIDKATGEILSCGEICWDGTREVDPLKSPSFK